MNIPRFPQPPRPSLWYLAAALLAAAWPGAPSVSGVEPFHAPPLRSGSIEVRLHPTEGITGSRLVTFGVPFPRDSVTPHEVSRVRVLRQGREVPARVETVALWRDARRTERDGASVRVVRIQLRHEVGVAYPGSEPLSVEWGGLPRALAMPELVDPRAGWHRVTSGSFTAGDGVHEPDVLAVLPKSHLSLGALKPVRFVPLADSVPATREDPAVMGAIADWPGFEELDHAAHNFLFTLLNADDPRVSASNLCPYREEYSPWLYDRASVLFTHYFRSGRVEVLREAIRATEFYRSQLYPRGTDPERAVGLFRLKIPNPLTWAEGNGAMYSYDECLAYLYWLAGDDSVLPTVEDVVSAHEHNDEPTRWSPSETTWTERHTAFRLLASVVAFELTGSPVHRANVVRMAADFIWHQNGADGALPANRVDGGLYHFGRQHGDGVDGSLVASPWNTVLTLDAMLRVYAVTEDPGVADFIRRLGGFWKAACKTDQVHQYDTHYDPLPSADYMMTFDGTSDPEAGRDSAMVEHSLDLASGLVWTAYFSELVGRPDDSLARTAMELYRVYGIAVNYWTRPNGPTRGLAAFRLTPWQKYAWEHRLSGTLGWVLPQVLSPDTGSTPPTLRLALAGGEARLVVGRATGVWQIESAATLGTWLPWTVLTNPAGPLTLAMPATESQRFFRVIAK